MKERKNRRKRRSFCQLSRSPQHFAAEYARELIVASRNHTSVTSRRRKQSNTRRDNNADVKVAPYELTKHVNASIYFRWPFSPPSFALQFGLLLLKEYPKTWREASHSITRRLRASLGCVSPSGPPPLRRVRRILPGPHGEVAPR